MAGALGPTRETDTPHIAPGAVVADKYVVEEVLGSGAMGFVVSARHRLIGQRVAIKFIKPSYVQSAEALGRFNREARALVAVQSENVVRVFDYGMMPDDSPYLVMEYLTGRDLQRELRARGALPLGEAAEIVVQACEGLAAVHARGIVHRDIKPANLFLTVRRGPRRGEASDAPSRTSGRLRVKIVDFGISKAPKMSDEELSLTQNAIGSPHYMSPEQLRNSRSVDARSDVWSLGVTLYRALTGELPFAGESVGNLMAAVMAETPRRLRDGWPELPREVDAIVLRCLEKDAEKRFASVHELADALAPFAAPTDASTGPGSDRAALSDPERSRASSSLPVLPRELPVGLYESTARAHVLVPAAAKERDVGPPEWKPRAALAAAIALPLVGVFLLLSIVPKRGLEPARSADASATTAPLPSATVITDRPLPKTTSPEAAAAYQTALQAVRDASFVVASRSFQRAAQLDPTMAAAELRSAVYGGWLFGSDLRRHARAALALRASLSERDRALLTAVEPLYLLPQADRDEAKRRMDALVVARPRDSELVLLSALLFLDHRPREEVLARADRALALDPKLAAAQWLRALTDQFLWDRPAAMRAVDDCLAISPLAASCLRVRATIEALVGDCAALEADARRMVAMEGESYRAHEFLALALFARGRPMDAVRESLARKWRASPEGTEREAELLDEARLAIDAGDFAAAVKAAAELEQLGASTGTERDRRAAALLLVDLHTEMGETGLAAEVADRSLRRMAWSASDAIDDDPRPRLYAAAVRGGRRTPGERDLARAEWVALWSRRAPPFERARVWVEGFAAPAETRQEAEAALASLPEYAPVPTLTVVGWTAPALARTYVLAGRAADALAELRMVTSSCQRLAQPLEVTRAEMELGVALEATGDVAGACAADQVVIDRWGSAKRSVTASAAKARFAALGCPRSSGR